MSFEQIQRNLTAYAKEFGEKERNKIARKGGNVLRDAAKARVAVDKGNLRASIKTMKKRHGMFVGPKIPQGAHGSLVEYGAIRLMKSGKINVMPPQPYMRPAIESSATMVGSTMMAAIKRKHNQFKPI